MNFEEVENTSLSQVPKLSVNVRARVLDRDVGM